MAVRDQVIAIARQQNLLGADGELVALQSLKLIDFVVALETECSVEIPSHMLTASVFSSIDAVDQLVTKLSTGS